MAARTANTRGVGLSWGGTLTRGSTSQERGVMKTNGGILHSYIEVQAESRVVVDGHAVARGRRAHGVHGSNPDLLLHTWDLYAAARGATRPRRPLPSRLLLVVDRIAGLQPQLAAAVSSRARRAQLPSPRPIGVVQLLVRLPQPLMRRRELDLQPSQLLAQHEDPVGCVPRRRWPPCQDADIARARSQRGSGGCGFGWFERGLRGARASRCAALALRVSTSAITSSVSWSSSHALHEPCRSILSSLYTEP